MNFLMNVPVVYDPDFVSRIKPYDLPATYVMKNRLMQELMWNRHGATPRYEYYSNDHNVPYVYGRGPGKRQYDPQPWHDVMSTIRDALHEETGIWFDVCFLNLYADKQMHLGWHADDSPEMDDNSPIAIVSLGAEREIWFRKNDDRQNVTKLLLENGSMCMMMPHMQDHFQHRIPKAGFDCGYRISLTFRKYIDPKA